MEVQHKSILLPQPPSPAAYPSSLMSPILSLSIFLLSSFASLNHRDIRLNHVSQEAANQVVRGGGGRIIALSPTLVATNQPGYGVYTASKAAVEVMVKTLAKETQGKKNHIKLCCTRVIADGYVFAEKIEENAKIATENNLMGRLGVPEDIGQVVGFLCSDVKE